MIWMPPPHWLILMLIALVGQIVVIGLVFARRGWRRGLLSLPFGFALFVASAIGGMILDGKIWPLDPAPLIVALAAGIYANYSVMTWRRAAPETKLHAV